MVNETGRLNVAIIGASGYTGAELVRLLATHPRARIAALSADRRAGRPVADVFPHLAGFGLPDLVSLDDLSWDGIDVAFCCLPHGTTQEVIASLPRSLKVVDLSADFRLADVETYAQWYGHPHRAPDLQKEAVYGLTEIHRDAVRAARLVANPGCYCTTAQLPLIPLIEAGLIDTGDIVIDAKSGVTGAGRSAKENLLYSEVAEGIHAYGVASHRHGPEIEQGLSLAARQPVTVNFTPHLMPMKRGILASIYVRLAGGASADDLRTALARRFADEPFVHVLPEGTFPATRDVTGSNQCRIAIAADRIAGRAMVFSVLDNLVKGASGQAIQNMNLMTGLPETEGLSLAPLFP